MFTLDQIRSFVAVAEELHFGHAAERLNMTQPPLSRQIQKLEKAVGVQLIARDNRTVSLTTAGAAFLAEARRLLVAADQAPVTARRIARGQAGVLRIGFTAASGFSVLGSVLTTLAEQLPDVDVDLHEQVTREQMAALTDGEIDLGLARPPIDHELFDSQLLLSEGLRLAVPADHELAALDRPATAADLASAPLIMYSPVRARYFYDLAIRSVPIQHGNVVHTVSQILTMVSLVGAGHGVAIVPESAERLGVDGVVHLPLADQPGDVVELHAVWRRGRRSPALQRLLAALEEERAEAAGATASSSPTMGTREASLDAE